MARMNFITEETPSLKKTRPPSHKWRKLFYISLILNVLLLLTTIIIGLK